VEAERWRTPRWLRRRLRKEKKKKREKSLVTNLVQVFSSFVSSFSLLLLPPSTPFLFPPETSASK
jgi:hypothetical protein